MDAECTHDGSVKHIQKFERWGWETLRRRVLDAERTDNLSALQVCNIILKHLLLCIMYITIYRTALDYPEISEVFGNLPFHLDTYYAIITFAKKIKVFPFSISISYKVNVASFSPLLMLQLQLLTNGFRLLKVGGFLVYSTCRCGLFKFYGN